MNLGYAQILTCPHCMAKKEVLSLISGNTFGQVVWSDNKSIAPMLPRVSFIQECPSCGQFFLMSRQNGTVYGKDYSWDKGDLSYIQLKEAWKQLSMMSDLTDNERLSSLIMQVWAFNDLYTRQGEREIPAEEHKYIVAVIEQLLALDNVDDLLKAELLRETGRFDEAIDILESYPVSNEFLRGLQQKFIDSAAAHNTRPFVIIGDDCRRC